MRFPLVTASYKLLAQRLCRNSQNFIGVMLSKAKHLAFSGGYEVEILRRSLSFARSKGLRMTL